MTTSSFVLLAILAQNTAPAATPEAKSVAQNLLSEGTRLFNQGEFAPALEKFTQAYAAYASPKLLYNIAQTNQALGRLAEAMESFERYLMQAPDALAEMTTEVHTLMADLQARLGRMHIECSTARAEISVDGKVVGLSPLADLVWAEPVKHQVTARHADTIPVVQDVEVGAGSIINVVLELRPLSSIPITQAPRPKSQARAGTVANPIATDSATVAESSESRPASQGWLLGRTWTWVAAGSTVALVAAAAIVGASMQSKYDSLNRSCGSASTGYPGCSESDISSVTDRKTTANILWALSGAAAVTTGILFVVEGKSVTVAPIAAASPGITARVTY